MDVKDLIDSKTGLEITIYGKDEAEEKRVSIELKYSDAVKTYDLTIYKSMHNENEGYFVFEIENRERAFEMFDALVNLYKEEL